MKSKANYTQSFFAVLAKVFLGNQPEASSTLLILKLHNMVTL